MAALLAQFDRIPDRSDATDPLAWDEHGLPIGMALSLNRHGMFFTLPIYDL
jgi:hypothetical protein